MVERRSQDHLRPSGEDSHRFGLAQVGYRAFLRLGYRVRAGMTAVLGVKAFVVPCENRKTTRRKPMTNDTSIKPFIISHLSLDYGFCCHDN